MTCSCQADNKWWNGVEMVVKLQVDMVDMVRETMRRFFLHSSLHKFMLTRRFSVLSSTTISFGWVLAVPGRSPSRNSPPIGTSNLGEPMRNCRFERLLDAGAGPRVPHMSHICPTCPCRSSAATPRQLPGVASLSQSLQGFLQFFSLSYTQFC